VFEAPTLYRVCTQLIDAVLRIDQALPFDERFVRVVGALSTMLPVALITLGVAVVAVVVPEAAQTGGLVAMKRAAPDFKRLNPLSGLKNLFGLRTAIETGITLAQFAILAAIFAYAFEQWCAQLLPSFALSFGGQLTVTCQSLAKLIAMMSLSQLVPAAVDFRLQRFQWRRRLRMDKSEVKRDYRDEEGDPYVKGRRRAMHRELNQ
jgi:type III secretion protein U